MRNIIRWCNVRPVVGIDVEQMIWQPTDPEYGDNSNEHSHHLNRQNENQKEKKQQTCLKFRSHVETVGWQILLLHTRHVVDSIEQVHLHARTTHMTYCKLDHEVENKLISARVRMICVCYVQGSVM